VGVTSSDCRRSGPFPLQELDVRVKLLSLILISLSSLKMGTAGLSALSAAFLPMTVSAGVSLRMLLKEFRYFSILLILIVAARGLTLTLSPPTGERMIAVSLSGAAEGAVICWRLLLVGVAGAVFLSTTRSSRIKAAVEWIFSPFPFVYGKRIAVMIAVFMRFLPLILKQARETADAQHARGIGSRKSPVYRMKKLVVPLLRRTLNDADRLALAMSARCYSETRTDPILRATRRDLAAFIVVAGSCILLLLI
jgi:energy-coupling factor transporter transmembrane protein EcfT